MTSAHLRPISNGQVMSTTVILSDKAKVVAHPGDKWKAGYVTLSRLSGKQNWRNIHLSKRSFEKLYDNIRAVRDSMVKGESHQILLTKKQHVMTSRFERPNQPYSYYMSFLHPTNEEEVIGKQTEINHAKTVNLSLTEVEKFLEHLEQLLKVVQSRVEKNPNDESYGIEGYRWASLASGQRSAKVFLHTSDCKKDAERHYFRLYSDETQAFQDFNVDDFYRLESTLVNRPTKFEVIEHVVYRTLQSILLDSGIDIEIVNPTTEDVQHAHSRLDKDDLVHVISQILVMLKYRNLFLVKDFVDLYFFFDQVANVKDSLVKHQYSPSMKDFARLIDYCYDEVRESVKTS